MIGATSLAKVGVGSGVVAASPTIASPDAAADHARIELRITPLTVPSEVD
jgi:hypothetical protein